MLDVFERQHYFFPSGKAGQYLPTVTWSLFNPLSRPEPDRSFDWDSGALTYNWVGVVQIVSVARNDDIGQIIRQIRHYSMRNKDKVSKLTTVETHLSPPVKTLNLRYPP